MTLTDSAVQVGTTIQVELRNPAAAGIPVAALACPTSEVVLLDSPMYLGQLRGYSK